MAKDTVAEIKERMNIQDIITPYVKLRRAGRSMVGLCPFHKEKTPSFHVSPERGTWHCFGCGLGGDGFSFIEKVEGLDFKGALKILAEKAGVELTTYSSGEREDKSKKERLREAMNRASEWYAGKLPESPAHKYAKQRALTDETVRNWRLGYAPEEWRALLEALTAEGFTIEELLAAGLIKEADGKRGTYYDRFRNRLMFPIRDAAGWKWGQPPLFNKSCVIIKPMPRVARVDVGEEIYHVINRANGRLQIFDNDEDYRLFEQLLLETKEVTDMRILAYELMPNHWHLVLYPRNDGDLAAFMHKLSNAHTRKVHARTNTNGSGHLYQGRYKSFLVDSDNYLLAVIKYVERNAVRAKLVDLCEKWRWGSAWRRLCGTVEQKKLLDEIPTDFPDDYTKWINTADKEDDLNVIRNSVNKSVPYGKEQWVDKMVSKHHLESTMRSPGRPRDGEY